MNVGEITFKYCNTSVMSVNLLTKGISRIKHHSCMERIGLRQLGI